MINTINKKCRFYPCHDKDKLESCVFCFCPRWPCNDTSLGNFLKNGIWDCSECSWIHQKKTVDEIFDIIKKNYETNSTN